MGLLHCCVSTNILQAQKNITGFITFSKEELHNAKAFQHSATLQFSTLDVETAAFLRAEL
jgi:hypothetical protein